MTEIKRILQYLLLRMVIISCQEMRGGLPLCPQSMSFLPQGFPMNCIMPPKANTINSPIQFGFPNMPSVFPVLKILSNSPPDGKEIEYTESMQGGIPTMPPPIGSMGPPQEQINYGPGPPQMLHSISSNMIMPPSFSLPPQQQQYQSGSPSQMQHNMPLQQQMMPQNMGPSGPGNVMQGPQFASPPMQGMPTRPNQPPVIVMPFYSQVTMSKSKEKKKEKKNKHKYDKIQADKHEEIENNQDENEKKEYSGRSSSSEKSEENTIRRKGQDEERLRSVNHKIKRLIVSPVLAYVTKDGHIMYQKKLNDIDALYWLKKEINDKKEAEVKKNLHKHHETAESNTRDNYDEIDEEKRAHRKIETKSDDKRTELRRRNFDDDLNLKDERSFANDIRRDDPKSKENSEEFRKAVHRTRYSEEIYSDADGENIKKVGEEGRWIGNRGKKDEELSTRLKNRSQTAHNQISSKSPKPAHLTWSVPKFVRLNNAANPTMRPTLWRYNKLRRIEMI